MNDLKPILESLLFVAEEPLTVDKLNSVLELADKSEIRSALEELREILDNREGGFHLREVAGGWQLRTRPEYHEWIKRMLQPSPQRLSRAALETLAIVAYKQPVIRADIEYIRGVDSGGVLRQLMERKLIRVLGRKEIPGRPLIYATTKLFLELFDLKDLKDLPSPKEIEDLSGPSRSGAEVPDASDSTDYETDAETDETEMTTEGSTEDIPEDIPGADMTETPAESEANAPAEDEATQPADLTQSESISTLPADSTENNGEWIDPDLKKTSELNTEHAAEDDADIPEPPAHHEDEDNNHSY